MTGLSVRASDVNIETYRGNITMVAQQMNGRIRPYVSEVVGTGEATDVADLVGTVRARRGDIDEMRNHDNPPNNTRRWAVLPDPVSSGQYLRSAEKMARAMDPTSTYVTTHTKAVVREIDDICMGTVYQNGSTWAVGSGGILGGAVEGRRPGGALVPLPAKCYTAQGGAGMTLDKLKEAVERLQIDEFGLDEMDQLYCGITPRQHTELLDLADGNGQSLNAFIQQQLVDGRVTKLLSLDFVVTNSLPMDGNGDRMCPIWAKSNIALAIWKDITGDMWNDTHAKNTPYAQVEAYVDAVRIQDDGVHVIACQET